MEHRVRPPSIFTIAEPRLASLLSNLQRPERDLLAERAYHEQDFLNEVREELEKTYKEDTSRQYCNGQDWRFKIPMNKDGTRDVCYDVTFTGYWSLSSCKAGIGCGSSVDGYGINELLSDSVDRYWQSDGPQPHSISVEFNVKTDISFIMLYLDYKNDESYTPCKVNVQLGGCIERLEEGKEFEFNEPIGWQALDMRKPNGKAARTFVLQLQVLSNHQNGRDTHIRHIRLVGPTTKSYDSTRRYQTCPGNNPSAFYEKPPKRNIFQDVLATDFSNKCVNSLIIR